MLSRQGETKKKDKDLYLTNDANSEKKKSALKANHKSLRASERFRLQLKDRDTKRDNRAIVTRHWQR